MCDTTKKYGMPVTDQDGRTIMTDLCCYCQKLEDLTGKIKCEHYALYDYDKCPCFEAVSDQARRWKDLFEARCH